MKLSRSNPFRIVCANDNDALIPEVWAAESVEILYENMVAALLVHRDFENEIASFGDVVNTRQPTAFTGKRKVDSEDVTVQDAVSTNIAVPLNQHWHTSFTIKDGEASKSFKDLVAFYLRPAIESIAQGIDKSVLGFLTAKLILANVFGLVGTSPTKATILGTRNKMNKNKAYPNGRRLVLCPDSETDLLELDAFTDADRVGDDGTALCEAALGKKLGFDCFMAQNTPAVETGGDATATTISAAAAKGATTITLTSATSWNAGQWCNIGGNVNIVSGISSTTVTLGVALNNAVASGAAATTWGGDTVDQALTTVAAGGTATVAGYRAGWHGYIAMDGTPTATPEVGQLVSFTATAAGTSAKYVVIDVIDDTIMLDRPLDVAVADGASVFMGPVGNYNLAFHRNVMALVTRPLAMPRSNLADSAVANDDQTGLSIRVTITYNGTSQGHLVTVDILSGIQLLDSNLGCAMIG